MDVATHPRLRALTEAVRARQGVARTVTLIRAGDAVSYTHLTLPTIYSV